MTASHAINDKESPVPEAETIATCSEYVESDDPADRPWGREAHPCGEPASHAYRWSNMGLRQTAHKCDIHAPVFEARLTREGIAYQAIEPQP